MLSNHVDRSPQLLIHSIYAKKSSLPIRRKENIDKLIYWETLLNKKITFSTFPNRSTSVSSILRVVMCRIIQASKIQRQSIRRIISVDSFVHVLQKNIWDKNNENCPLRWTFKWRKFVPAYRCIFLPYPFSESGFYSTSTSHASCDVHTPYNNTILYLFIVARIGCLIFHGLSARGLVYCYNKILRRSACARELFGTLWLALPGRPGGPGSEQNIFH